MSIIYDAIMYDKNRAKAQQKSLQALQKVGVAEYKRDEQRRKTEAVINKCVKRKKALISTSIKDFVELYSKIGKIHFQESEGIKELSTINDKLPDIEVLSVVVNAKVDMLSDKQEAILFLTRGLIGGAANSLRKEAEEDLAYAKLLSKQADVIEAQYKSIMIADEIVYQKVERITDTLTQINRLLRRSNTVCNNIIEKNGYDARTYSSFEKDCLMTCVNTAKVLKDIIDIPIFEVDGSLSSETEKLIELGNGYIQAINKVANN